MTDRLGGTADLSCDVAIIGAGTAGLAAQRSASAAGASTLLIDPAFGGTTCANTGCMPSKLLISAGDAAHGVREADTFGIRATPEVDGRAVMARVHRLRDRFVKGVTDSIAELPDAVKITARARFAAPDRLVLDDGRSVMAGAVVIATGSSPAIPRAFDAVSDAVLTNAYLFELDDLPRSVAVIGAGPIGVELAQALARLGVEVAVFDKGDRVAGLQDAEVSQTLAKLLAKELPLHLGTEPEVARAEGGVRLSWDGQSKSFERLLLAVGRPPNLDGLDLGKAGIALDEHGTPGFDPETLRCGTSRVFIAGDANQDRPLLHEASHEGRIAGQNAATCPEVARFSRHVPFVLTFTRPEAAEVGHIPDPDDPDIAVASAPYDDQGKARVEHRLGGLCRIYARRSDGRLTGASLCAPDAGHLAHFFALALEAGMGANDLLSVPFYHPTLEEGLKPALRALCKATGRKVPALREDDALRGL
ncbi:dihydrolipoyl dehydrogenase [Marinovum sp.]|uniref:dihydrolipoyl dehydrogenase n=1 Tax=Marinovum sp. TaxID=2024839 RepID=UPI002B27A4D8|nr:dihydrolipoyl dehydrogenase [Marinovum sp.]